MAYAWQGTNAPIYNYRWHGLWQRATVEGCNSNSHGIDIRYSFQNSRCDDYGSGAHKRLLPIHSQIKTMVRLTTFMHDNNLVQKKLTLMRREISGKAKELFHAKALTCRKAGNRKDAKVSIEALGLCLLAWRFALKKNPPK